MSQESLNIIPKLPYSLKSFVEHSGVTEAFSLTQGAAELGVAKNLLLVGFPRSGKTHFLVALLDKFLERGLIANFFDGSNPENFSSGLLIRAAQKTKQIILLDNLDKFLLAPDFSVAAFVDFYEQLRLTQAVLISTSSLALPELNLDPHIQSRLNTATTLAIKDPQEEDIYEIIKNMCWQRGFKFKERELQYLNSRLPKNIPGIEAYLEKLLNFTKITGKSPNLQTLSLAL